MDRRKTDRRTNEGRDFFVFDIQDLLDILWRRRSLLILIMLVVVVPGLLYIVAKPRAYEATANLMMEEPDYSLSEFSQAMNAQGKFDDTTFATQVSILSSPRLVEQTLQDLAKSGGTKSAAVSDADVKGFTKNLKITPVGKSRVISVSYKARNPAETADAVNAHIQNYIDYRIETKKQQFDVINKWLNEQVANLKEDSQKKGQAIQEFRGESGIVLGPDAENMIYQQIAELTQQLVPIETQKITLQSQVNALNVEGEEKDLPVALETETIKTLKTDLSQANQELKAISAQFGKNHPSRKAAQKRVSQISSDLANETQAIRQSIETELDSATKQEELLNARIDELNKQADQMQNQSLTMEGLQGELEANRKLLTAYMDRFQEIKTKMDLSRSDIRIINMAEVPSQPNGPGKAVLAALLLILAFILSITAVLLLELVDRGIETEADIKRVLNLRLLGSLPAAKKPLGGVGGKGRNAYTEELKRIYLAIAARKTPQTILITSAMPREGKTTVAISLAQYLASINAKVILVDADTASPSVATLAGTDAAPGFAELMAGAADVTTVTKRDGANLPVISAGDHDRYSVDILSSNAFSKMLDTLKSQYDYVIVDCASASSSTDAEVIAGQVDQVIFVVQWKKTAKKTLKRIAEALRQHARDIPNVILNKRG